jgi:hypothetical protein
MPRGTVAAVGLEQRESRILVFGQEIPVRGSEVDPAVRTAGARVRFDLIWDEGVLRATNVRPATRHGVRPRR